MKSRSAKKFQTYLGVIYLLLNKRVLDHCDIGHWCCMLHLVRIEEYMIDYCEIFSVDIGISLKHTSYLYLHDTSHPSDMIMPVWQIVDWCIYLFHSKTCLMDIDIDLFYIRDIYLDNNDDMIDYMLILNEYAYNRLHQQHRAAWWCRNNLFNTNRTFM